MEIIWKPIPNLPNYEVSNYGRVRKIGSQQMLRGQSTITLHGERYQVARLVLSAFVKESAAQVIFKDGDPKNCQLDNLAYEEPDHLPNEEWRPIPGYPGYFASNLGRIKHQGHLLKPYLPTKGHLTVSLGGVRVLVKKVVLLAFKGKPKPGARVICKDGNRENCTLSNLAYEVGGLLAQPPWNYDFTSAEVGS